MADNAPLLFSKVIKRIRMNRIQKLIDYIFNGLGKSLNFLFKLAGILLMVGLITFIVILFKSCSVTINNLDTLKNEKNINENTILQKK